MHDTIESNRGRGHSDLLGTLQGLARLRQWDGPLTELLDRSPGGFGLGQVPDAAAPDAVATAVCGFCSTGCGLQIHLRDGRPVNLSPDPHYPVNLGMACPKGWEALTPLAAPNRATTPLLRTDRSSPLRPASWPEAAAFFADRMRAVQSKHGPESAAFLSTGQIMCEEMAFLGCLAKFGMGMVHGDGNTRQCMATAVAAYKQSFGFDAPPYTYKDFEESDVLVFVGANPCIAHPILWQRVLMNRRRPRIIVVDPRRTETAMAATDHLAIAPKSDLDLLYGLAHEVLTSGWTDPGFVSSSTEGFDAFSDFLAGYPLDRAASSTGVPVEKLRETARLIGTGGRVSFWWTMGVNQSHQATRTAQAIINLALMTGNIGKPGTGANSITGQCNAMGSRLFSNTTNLLGGHRFTEPAHRTKIARVLGIEEARIPDRDSLAYDQILDGLESGPVRALWVIATNTAHSWIDQDRGRSALAKSEFLVVQDMYADTETAQLADLVLPAAAWGEKEGTFINSERRIGVSRQVADAPGAALSDFRILRILADATGCGEMFENWSSPEAAFKILKEATRDQPCDISGIGGYDHLDASGGIQWPLPDGSPPPERERRLFSDGKFFTPSGKAVFHFSPPAEPPEKPDDEFPLWLLTGRGTSAQWHTQTRTRNSDVLRKLYPDQAYIEIHPVDATSLDIPDQSRVSVTSRRTTVELTAVHSPSVTRGQVFIPMHYPECNRLTRNDVDPHSRQPNYKAAAVRIRRA